MSMYLPHPIHTARAILERVARCAWTRVPRLAMWLGLAMLVWQALGGMSLAEPPLLADPPSDSKATEATEPAEPAEEKPLGTDWVRIQYDAEHEPQAMQTAVVRYVPSEHVEAADASPLAVDLVAAVHVGDADYYKQLNEQFKQYDVVLYELVAPQGTVVPKGRGTPNDNILGMLQNGMKSMLELEHQLELVDYTQPNFVHADMSPDQLLESMEERNEDFLQMYFKMMGATMAAQQGQPQNQKLEDFDFMEALLAPDRARRLKVFLGEQLAEMETLMDGLGGAGGLAIISERNRVALDVLRQQIDDGKTKIAIFYGAGHLSDMNDRIQKDFDLEPASISWITAWDLSP